MQLTISPTCEQKLYAGYSFAQSRAAGTLTGTLRHLRSRGGYIRLLLQLVDYTQGHDYTFQTF